MTYFYELNYTQLLALKGDEDLIRGSNMNRQVRKILKKCSSKLAINCFHPAIVIHLNFILLSQYLERSVFSYVNPSKIWIAKDEVILENVFPFHTFGIFLLVGGVSGEASWKVRKEEGTTPGVSPQPKAGKASLQQKGKR